MLHIQFYSIEIKKNPIYKKNKSEKWCRRSRIPIKALISIRKNKNTRKILYRRLQTEPYKSPLLY